jgi:CheY-like chemotaxis protein
MAPQPSNKPAPMAARLLLVDDNKLGLSARRAVMEELGYEVIATSCPREAIRLARENTVDLVITDYRMPDMTGSEMIASLRGSGFEKPVILISGFVEALGLNEENTGADAVIQKCANEVNHMVRSVKALLKPRAPRKPPSTEGGERGGRRKKA